jgi:hypothetical protein
MTTKHVTNEHHGWPALKPSFLCSQKEGKKEDTMFIWATRKKRSDLNAQNLLYTLDIDISFFLPPPSPPLPPRRT